MVTLIVSLAALSGCREPFDPPVDCTDECGDACEPEKVFDYETYVASCQEGDGASPFCAGGQTGDCVPVDFDIAEATIDEIHDGLLRGAFDCRWLVNRFHEEIFEQDLRVSGGRPPLNAFVTLNPHALETAKRLDDYHRCEGELAGPLHCVPFVIKTNMGSKEVPTTNGSWALQEAQPNFDAFVVEELRKAGAITLGSTAMDEYARGVHGISSRSGKTGNAFDTRRLAGGSSSGSAAAVGANLAVAGLGTDNCASLTQPAAYNGLFTIRSSFERVSTRGIFPSNQNDVVTGPMTRTVRDLARFYDVMASLNPRDPNHCEDLEPRASMEQTALVLDGFEGKRIGVVRDLSSNANDWDRYPFEGGDDEAKAFFAAFFEQLEALGATVVDDLVFPDFDGNRIGTGTALLVDRYLEQTTGGVESFDDLCRRGVYPRFIWESEEACLASASQTQRDLERNMDRGREAYGKNRAYIESVMNELGLDALVYPADARGGAKERATKANCILPSVTGLPTIAVHAGHDGAGMPVGMLLLARMHDEQTLFEMAYAFEQATEHRRAPSRAPNTGAAARFDVARFNAIHDRIGWRVFDEIHVEGDKFDLNGRNFTQIVVEVLVEEGLEVLIDE
jgi:amidase